MNNQLAVQLEKTIEPENDPRLRTAERSGAPDAGQSVVRSRRRGAQKTSVFK
jgi:hypothetical protein